MLVLENYENRNLKFKKSEINFNNNMVLDAAPSELHQPSNSLFGGRENHTMVNFKSPFKTNNTLDNMTSLRKTSQKQPYRGDIVGILDIE